MALHPSSICTSYAPNTLKTHTTTRVTSHLTTGYGCADGLPSGKPGIAGAVTSLAQRSTRPTTCLKSSHSSLDIRSSTPDLMPILDLTSFLGFAQHARCTVRTRSSSLCSMPQTLGIGLGRWSSWCVTSSAHLDIDAFMRRYAWICTQEKKPKGKLTAYFEKFGYPRC